MALVLRPTSGQVGELYDLVLNGQATVRVVITDETPGPSFQEPLMLVGGSDVNVNPTYQPLTAGSFTASVPSSVWTLTDATQGAVTFGGVPSTWLCNTIFSFEDGDSNNPLYAFAIDLNGDVVGQAQGSAVAVAAGEMESRSVNSQVTSTATQRILSLKPGDVVRPAIAANTSSDTPMDRITLTLVQVAAP